MKVQTFYAKVAFTDHDGRHEVNSKVLVPYETDQQVAAAESMVAYGILSKNHGDDPATPYYDARDGDGQFAPKKERTKS